MLRVAKVKIKNQEWCADKGPLGAKCFNTLNDKQREISKEVWDKVAIGDDHRFGKVCTTGDNFGDIKAAILKLCKASKRCTYDATKKVLTFFNAVEKTFTEVKLYEQNFHEESDQ